MKEKTYLSILDQTLFGSLDGFSKAGTQFYRIQKLIEFFKQQGKGTLVTNVIQIFPSI